MKIKAQDNGPQQGSIPAFATIDIDVKDENDNYPLITPTFNDDRISGVEHLLNSSIIRIRENTPNGTFLVSNLVFSFKDINLFMLDSISRYVRDEKDFCLSFYLRPWFEVNLSLSKRIPNRDIDICACSHVLSPPLDKFSFFLFFLVLLYEIILKRS